MKVNFDPFTLHNVLRKNITFSVDDPNLTGNLYFTAQRHTYAIRLYD